MNIKVNKTNLLEILKANRARHREIFLEAQEGYRKLAIKELNAMLRNARSGGQIRRSITLIQPMDQTSDYDRVIGMLELSEQDSILLEEHEYQMYVQDKWNWKKQFLANNSGYSQQAFLANIEQSNDNPGY